MPAALAAPSPRHRDRPGNLEEVIVIIVRRGHREQGDGLVTTDEVERMRIVLAGVVLVAALAGPAAAQHGPAPQSPYAGEEARTVKSLSADDIAELRRGGGWGLAKAAELNGVPGPAHLLELKDEIPLTPEQVTLLEDIVEEMRAAAIA